MPDIGTIGDPARPRRCSTRSSFRPLETVPDWMEGESVYGWASRHHVMFGGSVKETGAALFGRAHACMQHDLPLGLEHFVRMTSDKLGTAPDLLRSRTSVAGYWPFMSAQNRNRAIAAADASSGVRLGMTLGLPGTKLGATHPLRSCHQCDARMIEASGMATWLTRFQLPGSFYCPIHHNPLTTHFTETLQWKYPERARGVDLAAPGSKKESQALHVLALQSQALLSAPDMDPVALRLASLQRLRSLGLCATDKRLSVTRIQRFFDASPVGTWLTRTDELNRGLSATWIPDLVRGRTVTHPLRWLLLWNAMVWDLPADEAVGSFIDAGNVSRLGMGFPQMELWGEADRRLCLAPVPAHVSDAFEKSASAVEAAQRLGVSLKTAKAWLEDYPQLLADWKAYKFELRLAEARRTMLEYMSTSVDIKRGDLYSACPADYLWLRTNSPRTLRGLIDRIPSVRNRQRALFP